MLAVLLDLAGLESLFNATKVLVFALFGFWFLELLEALWWVVLVAAIVPLVDILSVYRGPTKVVVEEEPGLFERIAIAFALPGEDAAARLGPPDVIFFALFLAAATRFGLRRGATWVGMTAAISATLVLTYAFELDGLPALPAVSLGFLVPNADLLWARWRERPGATPTRTRPSRPRLTPYASAVLLRPRRRCSPTPPGPPAESSDAVSSWSFCRSSALGVAPLPRSRSLQALRDLPEVLRDDLVVVLDLVGHLVGDLVEERLRLVQVAGLARERLGEPRADPRELGTVLAESACVRRPAASSVSVISSPVVSSTIVVSVSPDASLASSPPQPAATSASTASSSTASLRAFTSSPPLSSSPRVRRHHPCRHGRLCA